jgi:hypothetical protein
MRTLPLDKKAGHQAVQLKPTFSALPMVAGVRRKQALFVLFAPVRLSPTLKNRYLHASQKEEMSEAIGPKCRKSNVRFVASWRIATKIGICGST